MAKILVVDDDLGILDALSMVLEEKSHVVETADKGDQMCDKLKTFSPELILLDVLISGTDGRHLCRQLKQDNSTKDIPVIMISAHPSARRGALKCGAEDFLEKPFETTELFRKINQFIN
jgi:DNA-binding response OmpR family regulator